MLHSEIERGKLVHGSDGLRIGDRFRALTQHVTLMKRGLVGEMLGDVRTGGRIRSHSPSRPPDIRSRYQMIRWWLLGSNGLVYLGWQAGKWRPGLYPTLQRHFTSSVANLRAGRYHTLLTSCYSHMGIVHLGVNMFALDSFLAPLLSPRNPFSLSPLELLSLYHLAGVASSLSSVWWHRYLRRPQVMSVGASGSLFGILTYFCLSYPSANLRLLFAIDTPAEQAILIATAVNLGLMAAARFGKGVAIDGAGHLGGTIVGAAFFLYYLEKSRREKKRRMK